ncbi:MAG: hypothetical protein HYY93_01330 [Planctomycetes bacterium]|nr:hypothetical protein [Planctomycetota bacterium]
MTPSDPTLVLDAVRATLRARRMQRGLDALVASTPLAALLTAAGFAAAGGSGGTTWAWTAGALGVAIMIVALFRAARSRDTESTAALVLDRRMESHERCVSALACLRGEVKSALSEAIVFQAAECLRSAGRSAIPRPVWPRHTGGAAAAIALATLSALWPWAPRTAENARGIHQAVAGEDVSSAIASLGPAAEHPALAEARREAGAPTAGGVRPSTAAAAAGALRRLDAVRDWSESLARTLAPPPTRGEAADALDRAIDAARRGTLSPTDRAAARLECPLPLEALSEFPACAEAATRIEAALEQDDLEALAAAMVTLRRALPPPAAAAGIPRLAEAFAAQARGSSLTPPARIGSGDRPPASGGISDAPGPVDGAVPIENLSPDEFVLRAESSRAEAMLRHDWPAEYDDCVRRYFER